MINLQKDFNHPKYVTRAHVWKKAEDESIQKLKPTYYRKQEWTCDSSKSVVKNTSVQTFIALCHNTYELALYPHWAWVAHAFWFPKMHSVLPNYGCVSVSTEQLINHTCLNCFHTEGCINYTINTQRYFSNRQFKLLLVIREKELGKVRKK